MRCSSLISPVCSSNPLRAEAEVRQHAQAMFLERGVFQTRDRTGLLLMISLFEHRIVILPDAVAQEKGA